MPPVKFSKALYDFEAFMDVEKNLSPRTRKAYVYDLERFADFWLRLRSKNPTLDQVESADIQRYLEHLRMDRDYKSTTLSRTIASIRVFFEFCILRGFLKTSPAGHLHNPRNPRKLPVFLVGSELRQLVATPVSDPALTLGMREDYRHLGLRDAAILTFFSFTGVRLQELVGLDLRDIDFDNRFVRVMGKGSKERMIPLNETLIAVLRTWLEARAPSSPGETALFLNRFGRRITGRGVQKMLDKHVLKSGIDKGKLSPHKLRHTFATLLHINGVDVLEIQALLGHSSILSTQIYTHASSARLKSAVKKLDTVL